MTPYAFFFEFFLVTASVVLAYSCLGTAPGAQNPFMWLFIWHIATAVWAKAHR
ncbi:MAG: hypothetical protein KHX35_11415 [Sutterella wadsworthensis]|nr:hypothetical protein [Sutterella wadsworthensis]